MRKSHARPRVQQAPGLPCALHFEEGKMKVQTSGATRRENAKHIHVIASAAKQSTPPQAALWIASLRSQ
jgi:hypothetical protein